MRYSKSIQLIKNFEGFSPEPYICPAGYKTIGYGHLIRENEVFPDHISEIEAENILLSDCRKSELSIFKLIKFPLNDNQLSALISFVFNLGAGALQRSTLRQKINRGEYSSAAGEFQKWIYANGKILKGLIYRRKSEAELFIL